MDNTAARRALIAAAPLSLSPSPPVGAGVLFDVSDPVASSPLPPPFVDEAEVVLGGGV